MKIRTLAFVGVGALGLLGSCKSSEKLYETALNKQYEKIEAGRSIINQYGTSTLVPNGMLSSIEGQDILYFSNKQDSIAYGEVNKLCNGLFNKAHNNGYGSMEELKKADNQNSKIRNNARKSLNVYVRKNAVK